MKFTADKIGAMGEHDPKLVRYTAMKQRPLPVVSVSDLERLCKYFTISPKECWIWNKTTRDKYARAGVRGVSGVSVSRLFRQEVFGDVVQGKVLDHLCNNPPCVNPMHLESVTQAENIRRAPTAMANINREKERCKWGHILGGDNLLANTGIYRKCKACHARVGRESRRRLSEVYC